MALTHGVHAACRALWYSSILRHVDFDAEVDVEVCSGVIMECHVLICARAEVEPKGLNGIDASLLHTPRGSMYPKSCKGLRAMFKYVYRKHT